MTHDTITSDEAEAMYTSGDLPQAMIEFLEDTMSEFDGLNFVEEKAQLMRQAMITAFTLGQKDTEDADLQTNELIMETMQKVADNRHFSAVDLMAWIMLINEYHGTSAQNEEGRIYTLVNLARVSKLMAEYDTFKFYLPHGDIEYQVVRKGGAPATSASTSEIPE